MQLKEQLRIKWYEEPRNWKVKSRIPEQQKFRLHNLMYGSGGLRCPSEATRTL